MTKTDTQHLRPTQLAARWGISPGHLANQRSEGRGVAYLKLGKHVAYRLADIEAYEDAAITHPVTA